ncbi:MAG: hypothetical protein CVU05_01455 [Bacteroidetes bacterium HGW-Bacteroidetes-21]|nr:MAG: hypothetical protein CVU05_01455 [Bacteroidetes bacterium HGW-Bacteroidetes-21]
MRRIAMLFSAISLSVFALTAQPSTSLEWASNLGGISYDYAYSSAVDANGNVIITGEFRGTADFDPGTGVFEMTSYGIRDVFVVKLDSDGDFLWAKQFGGIDNDYCKSVTVDASGNIYFTGNFKGTADFDPGTGVVELTSPNSAENAFICKLDIAGDLVWVKHILPDMGFPGIPSSKGESISFDPNGNIIISGTFNGGNDFDPGSSEFIFANTLSETIFILKLALNGDFVWAKRMPGSSTDGILRSTNDASGNVYLTAVFSETPDFDPGPAVFNLTSDDGHTFVAKLYADGSFAWAKQFSGSSTTVGNAITVDLSGNVYTTGYFQYNIDFDPGAATYELTSAGSADIYLVKLDNNGDFVWANRFGSGGFSAQQGGYTVTTDQFGFVYLGGVFNWSVDFDPSSNPAYITSVGNDIFIAKYDASGNYIWAKAMGSTGENDYCLSVNVDLAGNVYAAGYFQYTVDFDPGYQVHNITSAGQVDAFVLKLGQCVNTTHTINETVCDIYSLNGVDYTSSGTYHQYFVNAQGCDSIITINLTVNTSPVLVFHTPDTAGCLGQNFQLGVQANGTTPIQYQWYLDGNEIVGATSDICEINPLQSSNDGAYTCVLTNSCGSTNTVPITLHVIEISADAGSDTSFCNSSPVQLQVNASSNYPSESGVLTYNWTPNDGLSSANIPNPTAQPMTDIGYSINVIDENGCQVFTNLNVTSQTPLTLNSQPPSKLNVCIGSGFDLQVGVSGSNPMTYEWTQNGNIVPMGGTEQYQVPVSDLSHQGIYVCEVSNACNSITTANTQVNIIELSTDITQTQAICLDLSTSLSVTASSNNPTESGTLTYSWNPASSLNSSNAPNVIATPDTTTQYVVIVTDANNCAISDSTIVEVRLPFADEEICLVTVDTLSWKNKIMWEKTPAQGILGYNVYKEVATNVYSGIGYVSFTNPAEYTDANSQPESYANRYKISVIDTCGNESEKSYYHNTMNLTIAAFGSTMGLSWTSYSDESGNFVPSLYYIYRGTSPTNMTFLASIPGTQTSYNDNNVFSVYYYIVGVMKTGGCNTGKSDMISFSNKKDNTDFIGIEDNRFSAGTITISPNPMTTSATLEIPNWDIANGQWLKANSQLKIMDITGKVVRSEPLTSHLSGSSPDETAQINILRGDLKPGIYFVELKADRIYRGKLIVE